MSDFTLLLFALWGAIVARLWLRSLWRSSRDLQASSTRQALRVLLAASALAWPAVVGPGALLGALGAFVAGVHLLLATARVGSSGAKRSGGWHAF